jgi:[protein-PII] uridylyltransferase
MDVATSIALPPLPTDPIDWHSERVALTQLFRASGDVATAARPAILAHLSGLAKTFRAAARADLDRTGNGRACAAALAEGQDDLIRLIYDYVVAHVYHPNDPGGADQLTVVATGGYGRGLLAPGSDIDLLFLLPSKQSAWGETVAEAVLYFLWDLKFKVGHATRTIDQCLKQAQGDMTIRTSLLDCRLVRGDAALLDTLVRRLRREVLEPGARAFVEAKLAERDQRHARIGDSRYRVEPNVKDGKGGLRDLHTLSWIASAVHGPDALDAGSPQALLSRQEAATFRRCETFLWTVRCHLHFLAGKAEERLAFEWQPQIASQLGYVDRGGLRAVERFMKHYFLVAKDVGDLTATLCATLEVQHLKPTPTLAERFHALGWRQRRALRHRTDFRIENGRITVADRDVFRRDPVNLIRYFAHAEANGVFLHPDALRLIRASERLIDDALRDDPEANRIFLDLLTSQVNPEAALRRMNEAGVLGRFVPDFGRIVAMTQFNLYHHYTVDEHLLRTVGELTRIEDGAVADALPLSTAIIKTIQNRRALFVAAFLHDIGKGGREDHSIVGARIARRLAPRFGLDAAETETAVWLIEQHLTMSMVAQSRDLADPRTIRAFADVVQSPERLKLLLLLTVADIRAVGPTTWNGWKGQLLRTLYAETEPLVSGGAVQQGGRARVDAARSAFLDKARAAGIPDAETFMARQYPEYWLKTDTARQLDHARLAARAAKTGEPLATSMATDRFRGITELTVLAPDHARLLALFAGACAAAGANIASAYVSTTRDGFALDTFLLQRSFEDDDDELRRAGRIATTIRNALDGRVRVADLIAKRTADQRRPSAFVVPPEVIIDNALSDAFTVIEVAGLDRPGLLSELTNALSDLNLNIASAHITTFGEKAVDVFYVSDLTGKKIEGGAREKAIRTRLLAALG